MDTNLLSDHKLVIYILGQMIKRLCNCPLIYESQVFNQEEYPFFTYSLISTEQDETLDWIEDNQPYQTLIQFDAYAKKPLDAQELSMKFWRLLKSSSSRAILTQADIVPQKLSNSSNRTILATENYQYRFGFDATFLVLRGNAKDVSKLNFDSQALTIESVSTKEEE